jgi:hypothetical protein
MLRRRLYSDLLFNPGALGYIVGALPTMSYFPRDDYGDSTCLFDYLFSLGAD